MATWKPDMTLGDQKWLTLRICKLVFCTRVSGSAWREYTQNLTVLNQKANSHKLLLLCRVGVTKTTANSKLWLFGQLALITKALLNCRHLQRELDFKQENDFFSTVIVLKLDRIMMTWWPAWWGVFVCWVKLTCLHDEREIDLGVTKTEEFNSPSPSLYPHHLLSNCYKLLLTLSSPLPFLTSPLTSPLEVPMVAQGETSRKSEL